MRCPSLLSASQDIIRSGVRARFVAGIGHFENDFAQRQRELNEYHTPPLYNFSQIFVHAIEPFVRPHISEGYTSNHVLHLHMDVLGFISPEREKHENNSLCSYTVGMPQPEGPVRYERFIQFIGWVQLVQPEVVHYILQNVSEDFQDYMYRSDFSMEFFRLALKWDEQYGGVLLFNNEYSHLHIMMEDHSMTRDARLFLLDKIKEIVALHGDRYLMYIPTSQYDVKNTLVALMIRHCNQSSFNDQTYAMMYYLIHTCPAALKIRNPINNAFTLLCKKRLLPHNETHMWMLDNVMRYADTTDVWGIVPHLDKTLLQLATDCRNEPVVLYIRDKFGNN